LSIYDEAIAILEKEGLLDPQPPDDPSLISWSPRDAYKGCTPFLESPVPIPCMMITPEEFPPLEISENPTERRASKPFIQNTEIQPDGRHQPLSQAEEVLNWHTENSRAQNAMLQRIDAKVDKITTNLEANDQKLQHLSTTLQKHYRESKKKIALIEEKLQEMLDARTWGEEFVTKERELRHLKEEVRQMDELAKARAREDRTIFKPLLTPAKPPVYASPIFEESSGFLPNISFQTPSLFSQPLKPTPLVSRSDRPKKQKTPKLPSSSSEDDTTTSKPPLKPHGKGEMM